MNADKKGDFILNKNEVIRSYIRSSKKAGGQNLNKVSSCVQLTHLPSGIQIKVQDTRDQNRNEVIAWERLTKKLQDIQDREYTSNINNNRNIQIGNGDRGTKKRTYRIKDDIVIDHITGKECRWKDFLKGRLELLS